MKIAMVGDLGRGNGSDMAGTGRYDLASLAGALTRHGHEVTLFSAVSDDAPGPADIRVERIPVDRIPAIGDADRSEALMPAVGEIGRHLIDAWGQDLPDVVHCHGRSYGMAAQLAAKRLPVPTVQSFDGLSTTARRLCGAQTVSETALKVETLLARNATTVTAACNDDMGELIRLGCPRARVAVLPHGVDVDEDATEEDVSRGGAVSRRLVAVARDFSPQQNLAQVLRVLPSLGAAELVLVATDPGDVTDHRRLVDMARDLRVADRVRVAAGVRRESLTAEFRAAEVIVLPAPYESSCATALEAMACGVPVVATAAGGVRDAVIADVTGLLVEPGDPQALGRALRSILGQTVLRQGMGLAGRSRARSRYSWDRIATDAEVVYTAAAARHGRAVAPVAGH
ncbi:glycosyltransferase involved in cell wall biosynthesis [Mycolicibacterium iranicum]|uniref:Glycosyltransferase involved in cell wall biosynthesis n=1 Tax=Mycolicibacterium iranicum TaxID=912594 RepID=A0A839QDL9_MYCIR|nr:glycosyltransferase [Mycolicibacterium iranicum]MBB2992864.1 glycosyltransferase involved in cell wall biosynthesis [Mycolicibacterium iranicum]